MVARDRDRAVKIVMRTSHEERVALIRMRDALGLSSHADLARVAFFRLAQHLDESTPTRLFRLRKTR